MQVLLLSLKLSCISCGLGPTHASASLAPDPLQGNICTFEKYPIILTMRNTIIVVIFVTLFGSAAWYSLTQTLDDLTRRDCQAGVVKACEALAQSK